MRRTEGRKVNTGDIEVYLRDFGQECFAYKEGKINGTELGMAQVYCVIKIKKLYEDKD